MNHSIRCQYESRGYFYAESPIIGGFFYLGVKIILPNSSIMLVCQFKIEWTVLCILIYIKPGLTITNFMIQSE